jgi:amino acid permease
MDDLLYICIFKGGKERTNLFFVILFGEINYFLVVVKYLLVGLLFFMVATK